jgi:Zn finger protein HypA/HybF involved in hydrogenase expression
MHEFSIASGLVEKLLDFVEKNPDKKIVEVRIAIGEFTQIEEEQLRFCYESIITEMPIAGSLPNDRAGPGQSRLFALFLQRTTEILERCLARSARCHSRMSRLWNAARVVEGEQCAICSVRFMPNEIAGALS